VETLFFVFEREEHAKRFVIRLVLELHDLAIYRDGVEVFVVDGGLRSQHAEIYRLAGTSATFALKIEV
jgi:hypothetical protein